MTYVPNTTQSDALLGVVTFTPLAIASPMFSVTAGVLGSNKILAIFSDPVDDTALDPSSYSISVVVGPAHIPSIQSIQFYSSNRKSVVLTLSQSLTYTAEYELDTSGVISYYGDSGLTATFTANVPDPPKALNAFFAGDGFIDIQFDRAVGPYTTSALGILAASELPNDAINQYQQLALTSVAWDSSIPSNNVRFSITGNPTLEGPPFIAFTGITDGSMNVANGYVKLNLITTQLYPFVFNSLLAATTANAFVDSISNDNNGPKRARINVFFNRPMLDADVVDPTNWLVEQQGVHLVADPNNIATLPTPLLANLINFCVAFRSAFNTHVSNTLLHENYSSKPDLQQIKSIVVDLLNVYNAHVISTTYHLSSDVGNTVALSSLTDLTSILDVLNIIKTNFNSHRVSVAHVAPDADFDVVSIDAVDLETASILADELRSKILNHEINAGYHVTPDLVNLPTASYSNNLILSGASFPIVTALDAFRVLEEAQSKYVAHGMDQHLHLYEDVVHTASVLPTYHSVLANAQSAASILLNAYNEHLLPTFTISISDIHNYASAANSCPPEDAFTYFAQIEVPATSIVPEYTISTNIQAEDLSSSTSFLQSVTARSGIDVAENLSSQISIDSIRLTFDKSISIPDSTSLSVVGSNSLPLSIASTQISPSLRSLFLFTTDLMEGYRYHNQTAPQGAGHRAPDVVNFLLDAEFPSCNLSSIIAALNRLRDVYYQHVLNSLVHESIDPNPIASTYAIDFNTAVDLARNLYHSLTQHNANIGAHTSPGAMYISHPLNDTITISLNGAKNGDALTFSVVIESVFHDFQNGSYGNQSTLSDLWISKSLTPYLAWANPKPGVDYTTSGMRYLPDEIHWHFSKPMNFSSFSSGDISITPSGVIVDKTYALNSQTLSTVITGMTSSPYSVDVHGFEDEFGNRLAKFIPPQYLSPVIPQTNGITGTLNGNSYTSFHYGDGRPAVYLLLDISEKHLGVLDIVPAAFPTETYLYDADLALLSNTSSSAVLNEIRWNLTPGRYIVETTVTNPLDTGSISGSFITRFDKSLALESTYLTTVGDGMPSLHLVNGYSVFIDFVADAVLSYIHIITDPSEYAFVWVMLTSKDGTMVASGGGSGTFVVPITTVIASNYYVEVGFADDGPHSVSIKPSDFP